MSFFLSLLGALSDFIEWCIGSGQRKIGQEQQQNVDLKQDNKILETELKDSTMHVDAADELHRNNF